MADPNIDLPDEQWSGRKDPVDEQVCLLRRRQTNEWVGRHLVSIRAEFAERIDKVTKDAIKDAKTEMTTLHANDLAAVRSKIEKLETRTFYLIIVVVALSVALGASGLKFLGLIPVIP